MMFNSHQHRSYSWPPPDLEYEHSNQGKDFLRKAVIAFMNAGEYQNAIEVLYTMENIVKRNDEPSDKLREAAKKYLEFQEDKE